MSHKLIGILVICLLMVVGIYALGPHTKFTHMNQECIYYYGSGHCPVKDWYCDSQGRNTYIILDRSECIGPEVNIGAPTEPKAEEPAPVAVETPAPIAAETQQPVVAQSYLWLVIPMLVLFAGLVILWIMYYETKVELEHEKHKKVRTLCPRCEVPMRASGALKQGPRGGLRQTYVCPKCNHRTMRTMKN